MTTINLKDFYAWYTHDEYIDVSDEVAAEMRADKLYEAAYQRRIIRNMHSIPSTVMMGSNTLPAFPSRPRRSCWSAWSVSAICGTR